MSHDPWRPSNGTEGEVFAANRCEQCVNDRWDHETSTGQSCPIWMNALAGVDDRHLYWDADAGHGECDMFYPKSEERAAGLDAAREAVNGLEPLLDVEKRSGGYDCCGCTTPGKLLADALAAIDALREKR